MLISLSGDVTRLEEYGKMQLDEDTGARISGDFGSMSWFLDYGGIGLKVMTWRRGSCSAAEFSRVEMRNEWRQHWRCVEGMPKVYEWVVVKFEGHWVCDKMTDPHEGDDTWYAPACLMPIYMPVTKYDPDIKVLKDRLSCYNLAPDTWNWQNLGRDEESGEMVILDVTLGETGGWRKIL